MERRYSENQIRHLHAEFKSLKKYTEKLAFFETQFGIIPFAFPDFDAQLDFFFRNEKTNELEGIFKKERNNPGLTEKKFTYGEDYIFNIKPANSNSSVYSHFILSRFLARCPTFEEWINDQQVKQKSLEIMLDEANALVNQIESSLQNEYDKSFRLQCMSVFYRGFYDAFTKRTHGPGKKRKFTELYLYAGGIIYACYIRFLKTTLRKPAAPVETKKSAPLDLAGKISLLNELGITEFLKKKYAGMEAVSLENKLAELISQITGEFIAQKERILLSLRNVQHTNGLPAFHLPENMDQKI
jgi:hypothetical protein